MEWCKVIAANQGSQMSTIERPYPRVLKHGEGYQMFPRALSVDQRSIKTYESESPILRQKRPHLTNLTVDQHGSNVESCEVGTLVNVKRDTDGYMKMFDPTDESGTTQHNNGYLHLDVVKTTEDERKGAVIDMMYSIREHVRDTCRKDVHMLALFGLVEHGLPKNKEDMPPRLECYWQYRDQLRIFNSLINLERKLVIPEESRSFVISMLLTKCREGKEMRYILAQVFWPEIIQDMLKAVPTIEGCAFMMRPISTTQVGLLIPTRPFQCIHVAALCVEGHNFLMVIDRYSKYFSCTLLRSVEIYQIVRALRNHFIDFGVCDEMTTSKNHKITQPFLSFVRNWAVNHHVVTSESHYPYHRCRVHLTLATASELVKRCMVEGSGEFDADKYDSLFQQYTTMQQPGGFCPTECLSKYDESQIKQREQALRITDVSRVDHDDVTIGAHVQVKRYKLDGAVCWYKTGVVVEVDDPSEETYMIRMDGSNMVRLMRKQDMKMFHPMVSCHPHRSICMEAQMKGDDGDDVSLRCDVLCRCWLHE